MKTTKLEALTDIKFATIGSRQAKSDTTGTIGDMAKYDVVMKTST